MVRTACETSLRACIDDNAIWVGEGVASCDEDDRREQVDCFGQTVHAGNFMMQLNAGQQPRQNPKSGSSLFITSHHQPQIQLPMLGPNLQVQQNKLQNQQPGPQQQQGPQPSEIPLPPQSGQDFTLSSVLHFLQTEWRRYERDRNEWEIERAEMRVRVLSSQVQVASQCQDTFSRIGPHSPP